MDPAGEQKKTRPRVGRKKNKRIAGSSAWDPIKFTFGLHSDSVIATEKSEKYTSWSFGEAHEESDPVSNGPVSMPSRRRPKEFFSRTLTCGTEIGTHQLIRAIAHRRESAWDKWGRGLR